MNIFQIIPSIVFIGSEQDEIFVENLKSRGVIDNFNLKITNTVPKNKYIVKPLDTISSVAKKLDISEQELIKITNCKSLYVGQELILPD